MAVIGMLVIYSEMSLDVRCLPVFGYGMLLLLSSLFFSLLRGIALLATLEHLVLMS